MTKGTFSGTKEAVSPYNMRKMPDSLRARLKVIAAKENRTLEEVVVELLDLAAFQRERELEQGG